MSAAADVVECGALADNTTPEWARGKVACERPQRSKDGCGGPHSARVTPPGATAPVTLSWASNAKQRPAEAGDEPREARPESDRASTDTGSVLGLVADAIASGSAALEARVIGHEEGGEFIVDEVVEVLGVSFMRPSRNG